MEDRESQPLHALPAVVGAAAALLAGARGAGAATVASAGAFGYVVALVTATELAHSARLRATLAAIALVVGALVLMGAPSGERRHTSVIDGGSVAYGEPMAVHFTLASTCGSGLVSEIVVLSLCGVTLLVLLSRAIAAPLEHAAEPHGLDPCLVELTGRLARRRR